MPPLSPEDRERAGRAVEVHMADIGMTISQVARAAKVDQKTVRDLIAGKTWPRPVTRRNVEIAINWPKGEIERRATDSRSPLSEYSTADLLRELLRRDRAVTQRSWRVLHPQNPR